MAPEGLVFNPPPGWPAPPAGWEPPEGWTPDPSWPQAPPGWSFWVPAPPSPTPAATVDPPAPAPAANEPHGALATAEAPATPPADAEVQRITALEDELQGAQADLARVTEELTTAQAELAKRTATPTPTPQADDDLVELDDERVLQAVGIYRYHHPLENAEEYREQLRDLQGRIKDAVRQGHAIEASEMFTFDNSLAKGRRMVADLSKLMLRAYNAEADNCVRSLRAGNVLTAKKRLEASVTSIAKLGSMMEMHVHPDYHQLRIEEIELTADFLMKQQEEKERAREERERLREERKAEQELAAERERLDKERTHYANALAALQASGEGEDTSDLEAKLAELDQAIEQNDYRAANIRAGYVYVISNRGAFGDHVVKIGMTRRLEPQDRIRELGDASVPFPFDVHALFFSDDAIALENELHEAFADRKLNRVNERREFFFATPAEVREVLAAKVGSLLEFTDDPESTQYLQSKSYWPEGI